MADLRVEGKKETGLKKKKVAHITTTHTHFYLVKVSYIEKPDVNKMEDYIFAIDPASHMAKADIRNAGMCTLSTERSSEYF